ncbi:choline dehydrogenase [gut metagenome]|uniref:Choline dehydrogenase n=1 Tax=gut metagenome TaxID=749906 RepID=J9BXG6_9ZZZZ
MTTLIQVFLLQMQHLATCDTKLFLHQVDPYDFFRNGVFHLQTSIHFKEVEVAVLVHQEFDSTGTRIVHSLGCCDRLFTHFLPQFGSQERRRTFFHNLLVTALYRTFTFEQVNHIAVVVSQNLEFNMVRFFDEFFQVYGIVTKRRHRFRTSRVVSFHHLVFAVDQTHTLTTATHRGFQHDRIANLVTDTYRFFRALQRLFGTRNHRHAGRNHLLAGCNLVAHRLHRFGSRANKNDAFLLASAGKISIFRQKTITGMNGIGMMLFSGFDDVIDVQITLLGSSGTNQTGFVGIHDVTSRTVGFRKNSHCADTHFLAGTHDADGNLTTIGY